MKKYLICFVFVTFLLPTIIFAHQPNYIDKQTQIIDTEPNISKAYYGELIGSEAVYKIHATSSLKLYVQVLSPKIESASKDFTVLIKDNRQNIIAKLSTSTEGWLSWYEDYGGDWYWQGPSFKNVVPAGTYDIVVSNSNNIGRYSLAIGEIESFPANDFFNTIQQLYSIKTKFFNEPWYGIFYGIIGRYLLSSLVILVFVLVTLIYFCARLLKKRRRSKSIYQRSLN